MTQQGNGGILAEAQKAEGNKLWMTLTGLPLTFHLEWPFHKSTSGADFWVLHGDIRLASAEGLQALVAVNLSMTVREVLPSLEPPDAEAPVINALRKEVDRKQIEFVKSGKLLPVAFSSRHYDFKRGKWVFGKASDEAITEFLQAKVYWQTKLDRPNPVWIADPTEAQYLESSSAHLMEVAARLGENGLFRLDGERAEATPALISEAERFEAKARAALADLEKKHAFERG